MMTLEDIEYLIRHVKWELRQYLENDYRQMSDEDETFCRILLDLHQLRRQILEAGEVRDAEQAG